MPEIVKTSAGEIRLTAGSSMLFFKQRLSIRAKRSQPKIADYGGLHGIVRQYSESGDRTLG